MIKSFRILHVVLGVAIGLSSCNQTLAPIASSNKECVQNYDPTVDYFADKVKPAYAKGFTVSYQKHYKIVSVSNAWKGANTSFQYILVQCGTPIPAGFSPEQIIQIPVQSIVVMSTTHLPHLQQLGVVDRIKGVSDFKQINTPSVIERIKSKQLAEVGSNQSVNVEKILDLAPELVTTFGSGDPKTDAHPKLLEAGLKVAIVAEYMESSPLGRAEWLKFMSLFFNREAKAEKAFEQMAKRYNAIAQKAKQAKRKPSVFAGFDNKGTWYAPGGDSYAAKFLEDAGAKYLWQHDRSNGSLNLSFEKVFDRANQAEFWLNGSQKWNSLKDVLASDDRYQTFAAIKSGKLFTPTARLNETGGNDYWESGMANPDVILADLVKIFHPELMPDRQLVYYRQLSAK